MASLGVGVAPNSPIDCLSNLLVPYHKRSRIIVLQTGPSPKNPVNLKDTVAPAGDRVGVIWTLNTSSELTANVVRFGAGRGVEEHVNDEVEVIVLGVSKSGIVAVDREEHVLSAGILVFIPKGARRSTVSTSEDFAYLTIHRRRGPLHIGLSQGA